MALSYIVLLCTSLMLLPEVQGDCKKMKSNVCQHLEKDYTMLNFPNIFGHKSEEEALEALKQTQVISSQVCDDKNPSFRNFLCALYFPPCNVVAKSFPPCRSNCAAAYNTCFLSLASRQMRWESNWTCEGFPRDGLCLPISPSPPQPITVSVLESVSGKKDKEDKTKIAPPVPIEGTGRSRGGSRRPRFQQCAPFKSMFCTNLDYETAAFPNLMGSRSPQEADAIMNRLSLLLKSPCGPHLKNFMCGVLFPRCEGAELFAPCQSLCQDAYNSCSSLLSQYRFAWPSSLQCQKFPPNGNCYKGNPISPVAAEPTTPPPSTASPTVSSTVATRVDVRPVQPGDVNMLVHPILEWLKSSTNLNRERSKLTLEEVKLAVLNQQKTDLEITKLQHE